MCEDIQLHEIEEQGWILTIDNESQMYESIYDAINELAVRGFNATFHIPKEMEDVNPMDKCF